MAFASALRAGVGAYSFSDGAAKAALAFPHSFFLPDAEKVPIVSC